MGTDKGMLKPESRTWGQTAIDKMAALNIAVKISVNNNQLPAYSTVFSSKNLIADNSSLCLSGPLLGVLSSHLQYPSEDLFIFACDMPLMEPFLLQELNALYLLHSSYDVYIFTNDGDPEPLCGIYTSKGLSAILTKLREGALTRHSMKFILGLLHVKIVPATDEQKKYFRNVNDPAGLDGL